MVKTHSIVFALHFQKEVNFLFGSLSLSQNRGNDFCCENELEPFLGSLIATIIVAIK